MKQVLPQNLVNGGYFASTQSQVIYNGGFTSDHINGILKHQIFDPDNSDSFMFWSILNPGEIEICLGSTEKQERGVNVIGSLIDMSFDIEDIIFPDEDEGCKECAIKLIKKLRNIADELEKSLPKLKAVK